METRMGDGMSKMRELIVKCAQAHRYWYTHQANATACDKANRLQKQAYRLINQFGVQDERAAYRRAKRCTMQMVPSRGTE